MKKGQKGIVIATCIAAFFAFIQFIPVTHPDPSSESDFSAPAEVQSILKVSCYDCHSHETVWPWYSRIAPASWLIVHDAAEARARLNFSAWSSYAKDRQQVLISDIIDVIEEDEMPPFPYTWMHAGSDVTRDELKILKDWAME